jgi:cell wall-associated NlpC family hydrolase
MDLQKQLVEEAYKLKGASYKLFPCGVAIRHIYKSIGILLPSLSIHQALCGREITPPWGFQVGDLLFFRGRRPHRGDFLFPGRNIHIGHVAMYIGEGRIVEASSRKGKVVIKRMNPKKEAKILMVRRVLTGT